MPRRKSDRPQGRGRVAALLVLCCVVFLAFFARLAWMQFAMADHYAEKVAEASSASYTVEQHAARGAITDRNGTILARDTTVYDLYLRVPAPPGTDLQQTVQTVQALTGGKDVETQLAAFCSAVSAGELLVLESLDSATMTAIYRSGLVQSGAVRLAARGERTWPDGTLLPHVLGFTGPITAEQWPAAQEKGLAMDSIIGQSGLEAAYDDLLRGQDGRLLVNAGLPLLLTLLDAPDVPVLRALVLPYLVLPLGGFFPALSLGKRQGLRPLYPLVSLLVFVPASLWVYGGQVVPLFWAVALAAPLLGNLAGWAWRRSGLAKQRRS